MKKVDIRYFKAMQKVMDLFKKKNYTKHQIRKLQITSPSTLDRIFQELEKEGFIKKVIAEFHERKGTRPYGTQYQFNAEEMNKVDEAFSMEAYSEIIKADEELLKKMKEMKNPSKETIIRFENSINYWKTRLTREASVRSRLLKPLIEQKYVKYKLFFKEWVDKYWGTYHDYLDRRILEIFMHPGFEETPCELNIWMKNESGECEKIRLFKDMSTYQSDGTLQYSKGLSLKVLKEYLDAVMDLA